MRRTVRSSQARVRQGGYLLGFVEVGTGDGVASELRDRGYLDILVLLVGGQVREFKARTELRIICMT